MEILDTILNITDKVLMAVLTIGFLPQVIYIFLCFLKPKAYKSTEIKHHFGIVVPARNESKVIAETINSLKNLNYPLDKLTIFVIADNCTDNTAEIARGLGVNVIERFDDTKRTKGFAMNFAFKQIVEDYPQIESFIVFDADNLVHPDYVLKMNDAFDTGVELARGFSNSKNLTDNYISCVWGLYYIRDCRYSCRVRSALNTDQNMNGSGMMISSSIIKEKGWDCFGLCEDAEFTFKRMLEGKRTRYVNDAVFFEEQPVSMKDTFNRNIRMGHGLNKLFFTQGIPMLGKFFTTFRYGYLDMFLSLLFMPIAFICCFWFPIFYGYKIALAIVAFGSNPEILYSILKMAAIALTCIFYLPFVLQSLLCVALTKNDLKYDKMSTLIKASFLFPLFMIIYMLSITIGIISRKPQWKAIDHHRAVSTSDFFDMPANGQAQPDVIEADNVCACDNVSNTDDIESNLDENEDK